MNIAIRISLIILLSATRLPATPQAYELSSAGNKATIAGTSSLHDWEMNITRFSSDIEVRKEGTVVSNIENVTFSCRARDIKSDNSLMDKKTYEALEADDFPEIRFTGTSVAGLVSDGNSIKGTLNGKLTLAGQTRDITVPFSGNINGNVINLDSSAEMTFSSFGMSPPTAMLGALKTGDKVTVNFKLQYNQKGQ